MMPYLKANWMYNKRYYRADIISKNPLYMNFQIILSSDPVSISALHFVIAAYVTGKLNRRFGHFDSHHKCARVPCWASSFQLN